MDVALYHPWIHFKGGGEKVLAELLEHSRHDITIFTSHYVPENTYDVFEQYDVREVGNLPIVGELLRGASFGVEAMVTKLSLESFDAFVVSTGGVAELITYRNHDLPVMGFCHTPLRVAHDETVQKHKLGEKNMVSRLFYRFAIAAYKLLERPAWRFFDHVQFNSETTRSRALRADLIPEGKTSVNHPGADIEGNEPGDYDPYFFYPSRFAYYKRQGLALDAFEQFKEDNPDTDFELVLAGSLKPEKEPYFEEIKQRAADIEGVTVKANVDADEWVDLYRNCYTVLFCAMNEDWGITPIEAGSYAKPVIAVDEGGPTESVVDGETGVLVDASPEAFAAAMQRFAEEETLVREMGANGRERVQQYTWDRFVEQFDTEVADLVQRHT